MIVDQHEHSFAQILILGSDAFTTDSLPTLWTITRPECRKSRFFSRTHPQEAISLFWPPVGEVAENARLSCFFPLWAISPFGPQCF
jgi:hypothetical protein